MGILIENDFDVPAPVDAVWNYVLDVERIAPCMPGATLTEKVDEDNFKGKVTVKLGPVSLSFAGTATVVARDQEQRRVELKATGTEQRGKGSAVALVTAWVEPAGDDRTRVRFKQDITVTGPVAQFSRGMMQDVSKRLTMQFAECLKTNITAEQEALAAGAAEPGTSSDDQAAGDGSRRTTRPAPIATAKPITGIRLGLWAIWRAIVRFFRRFRPRHD